MANNDRRDRRDDRDDRDDNDREPPWDLTLLVVTKQRNGDSKEKWARFGEAWPTKEGTGFTFDVHFAIPAGSRCALWKPKGKNGGGR